MPPDDHSQTIDYRERAPLVVPPKQNLVAPEAPGAHRSTSWPQDPDVLARQKAEDEAHSPMLSVFDKRAERPTSKAESLKFRAAQTDEPNAEECGGGGGRHGGGGTCRVSPYEFQREEQAYRAVNRDSGSDVVTAGVEPEREYLTQPPKGYLKVNKTVKATAEAPVIVRDQSKPLSSLLPHPYDDPNN